MRHRTGIVTRGPRLPSSPALLPLLLVLLLLLVVLAQVPNVSARVRQRFVLPSDEIGYASMSSSPLLSSVRDASAASPLSLGASMQQCAVLRELYLATSGPSGAWVRSVGWNTSTASSTDCCSWYNVLCDVDTGAVAVLNLDQNGLVGVIPESLGSLTTLSILILANNRLSGRIPASFANLTNLVSLSMDNNELSGTTEMLLSLVNLRLLDLDTNMLEGPLPYHPGMQSVQEYYVQRNRFSGSIPTALLALPSLVLIDVSNNQLSGPFPNVRIPNAGMVRVASNQLSGALPTPLNMQRVFYFDASDNQFSGPIPDYTSDGAFTINAEQNPGLTQTCAVLLPAQADACLPPGYFLRVQNNTPVSVPDRHMVCPQLVARHPEQVASVDVSYLQYAQCSCAAQYFQQNSTERACLPCDDGCTCVQGRMSGCYPSPWGGPWQRTVACPPVGTGQTACNPNPALGADGGSVAAAWDPNAPLFVCATGYTDRLCSRCVEGYYRDGATCVACTPALRWLLPLLYVLFVGLLATYFLLVPAGATGVVRILVFYAQTAIVLVRNAGQMWPAGAVSALGQLSALTSFVVDAVACVLPGSATSSHLSAFFAIPPALLGLTLLIFVTGVLLRALRSYRAGTGFVLDFGPPKHLYVLRGPTWTDSPQGTPLSVLPRKPYAEPLLLSGEQEEDPVGSGGGDGGPALSYRRFVSQETNLAPVLAAQGRAWRRRCTYTALAFLNFIYFGVTERAFGGLSCTLLDAGTGQYYLNAYPWIPCDWSLPEFRQIAGASVAALLVFVLGIPALFLGLLWRVRHALSDRGHEETVGFLYGCFKPRFYAWEAVLIVRRVALAAVIRLIPFTLPRVASLSVLFILNVALLLQHVCRPHRTRVENALELTSLYVLLLSFLAATIAPTVQPLLVAVLVLNLLAVLVLFGLAILVLAAANVHRCGGCLSAHSRLGRWARQLHDQLTVHDGIETL